MEEPGQDPVLFFALRKNVRNNDVRLDFWICREPGEPLLGSGKGAQTQGQENKTQSLHNHTSRDTPQMTLCRPSH